ncbi:MAG: ABC transporter permease [bacterium]|nr:ABC transporter permease [bacterium]
MGRYFLRRLLQGIPTFFGVTVLSFLVMVSAPGDPVALITFSPNRDPESAEILRRQLGLDQPPLVQYLYWLVGNDWRMMDINGDGDTNDEVDGYGQRVGLLRGDLGNSIRNERPVLELIVERIPATLLLTFSALVVGYGAGILLGLIAAVYHKTWIDQLVRVLTVIGNAIPAFWLGLILIIFLSVRADLLPMGGIRDISDRSDAFNPVETLRHMVMPVFVLSLGTIAFVSRFTRTEILEVLAQDYIRTARAKGLAERVVWQRHATRNALLPVATFIGPGLGTLLSGAVIIEQVFDWPGMGRLVVNAVLQRDYPLVMGSVVVAAVLYILGVLLSDMLYALLDPRIQLD